MEQEVNLHSNKVTANTYETDYEMPCTSGTRDRKKKSKIRTLDGVFVTVCVRVSLAALRVRFPDCLGVLIVSLHDTHKADTLGCS